MASKRRTLRIASFFDACNSIKSFHLFIALRIAMFSYTFDLRRTRAILNQIPCSTCKKSRSERLIDWKHFLNSQQWNSIMSQLLVVRTQRRVIRRWDYTRIDGQEGHASSALIKWTWFNWVTPLRVLANGMWGFLIIGTQRPALTRRCSLYGEVED